MFGCKSFDSSNKKKKKKKKDFYLFFVLLVFIFFYCYLKIKNKIWLMFYVGYLHVKK